MRAAQQCNSQSLKIPLRDDTFVASTMCDLMVLGAVKVSMC